MKRHDLSLFHLERDGMKIKLKKGVDYESYLSSLQPGPGMQMGQQAPGGMLPQASTHTSSPEPVVAEPAPAPAASGEIIESPMVGTFYRSPGPGEAPFLKEGDRIEEGAVICIIEAMKVMNEIKAETSGVLARFLVNDATPVQYGQPLFELK